ncbi:hypothetical protein Tco_0864780 [Tanacetum coccineum]
MKIVIENPNHLNEPNEAIPKVNPVVPELNQVVDIHDPNEMVDIPDDIDLVDPGFEEEVMEDDDDVWDQDDEWLMAPVTPPRATVSVSSTYEVGGLFTATPTLQTARHGAELQNQQLRTRVAEMESREGTMMSYMFWMEERLTVLEKRLPGPSPRPQIMPPKAMSKAHMRKVIREQVAASMAEFMANMNRGADGDEAGGGGAGGTGAGGAGAGGAKVGGARPAAPEITGCTYITFMKCDLQPFKGTKGTVGLC